MARMYDDDESVVTEVGLTTVSQYAGVYAALVVLILLTVGADASDCCPSSETSYLSIVDTWTRGRVGERTR